MCLGTLKGGQCVNIRVRRSHVEITGEGGQSYILWNRDQKYQKCRVRRPDALCTVITDYLFAEWTQKRLRQISQFPDINNFWPKNVFYAG